MKQPGRPKFEPTNVQRAQVVALVACGTRRALVAKYLGIDGKTLSKHFKKELTEAVQDANSRIAVKLYEKAMSGDIVSMLFWLKCRANWKESSRHELTGPDGRPLPSQHLKLGISFEDGGPGLVRRVPYSIEANAARIAAIPPGADVLGDYDAPGPVEVPLAPPPAAEASPAPADPLAVWARVGLSADEFKKQKQ